MNNKLKKTLNLVFQHPVSNNIKWNDIEHLLEGLGAEKIEGNGSRVRFILKNNMISFNRPHPAKEANAYPIKDVKRFLENLEIIP